MRQLVLHTLWTDIIYFLKTIARHTIVFCWWCGADEYVLQFVVCERHAVLQLLHADLLPAVEAELGDGARHQEPVITEPRYVDM